MKLLNSGKLLIHPTLNNNERDVSKVLESCVNLLDIKFPDQEANNKRT